MFGRGGAVHVSRGCTAALVALVLALAAGACSDDGDASARRASSPESFAADYQDVTKEFETEYVRLRTEGRDVLGRGEDALIAFYERLADATAEARDRYRRLRPPEQLAPLQRRIVDLLARQATVLEDVVAHARAGSPELNRDLQELARLLDEWAQANREMSRRLDIDTATDEAPTTSTT